MRTLSKGAWCLHEQHYRIEIPANQLPEEEEAEGWRAHPRQHCNKKKEKGIQSTNSNCKTTVLDGVNVFACTGSACANKDVFAPFPSSTSSFYLRDLPTARHSAAFTFLSDLAEGCRQHILCLLMCQNGLRLSLNPYPPTPPHLPPSMVLTFYY